MKSLILNADDFGMTRGVNEGIVRAHREGILTSTTLMANGPAFDDAVERLAANPQLGVGCHLVLVGGKCIARRETVKSLADADGNFGQTIDHIQALRRKFEALLELATGGKPRGVLPATERIGRPRKFVP